MSTVFDYQNESEQWTTYVRNVRDELPNAETYDFDRFARELLTYLQNTKIKDPKVFLQQSGKEYPVMVSTLESYIGADVSEFLTAEMLHKTWDLAQLYRRLRNVTRLFG